MTSRISPWLAAVLLIALVVLLALVAGCPARQTAKTPPAGNAQNGMPPAQDQTSNPRVTQTAPPPGRGRYYAR